MSIIGDWTAEKAAAFTRRNLVFQHGLHERPWFDDAALRLLTQWYFPLSRGWAAALAADGSVERFLRELPCGRFSRRLLPSILARVEARRALLAAVDSQWEEAFLRTGPARADIEALRLRAQLLRRRRTWTHHRIDGIGPEACVDIRMAAQGKPVPTTVPIPTTVPLPSTEPWPR